MTRNTPLSENDARVLRASSRPTAAARTRTSAPSSAWPAPSAHERVKKLESRGVIRGYRGRRRPGRRRPQRARLHVGAARRRARSRVDLTPAFAAIAEIEECHYIAGEADYILKIRARDMEHLGEVVRQVQTHQHVFSTETDVVFTTGFEGRPLPARRRPPTRAKPDGPGERTG